MQIYKNVYHLNLLASTSNDRAGVGTAASSHRQRTDAACGFDTQFVSAWDTDEFDETD